ncbi:hypothetical protein IscW_ISCW013569 [Ixodes scapularis]|uniref:Uncharacterized protein n=1 Tax=Ixodes scapularis TaxID=6945 RepID=B7QJH9_IXOSC|nr:hypothetical protein IscW_ISCW013569 [Ixodes scapularis]|eukprot:XP_002415336.1 hypothetical protein IscW_ISCW013569 [Ixodes scapularis]
MYLRVWQSKEEDCGVLRSLQIKLQVLRRPRIQGHYQHYVMDVPSSRPQFSYPIV